MRPSVVWLARVPAKLNLTSSNVQPKPRGPSINYNAQARMVKIDWPEKDLDNAFFPVIWLRDACQAPHSVDPNTKQKCFKTSDIPLDIKPTSISVSGDAFRIQWNKSLLASDISLDGESSAQYSIYPLDFLKRHAHGHLLDRWLCRDLQPILWNKNSLSRNNLIIPYTQWTDATVKEAALAHLSQYGILFLSGVPTEERSDEDCELAKIAHSIGQIRKTWYGLTWDVKALGSEAKNVAYTNFDLGLHMDLVHFEDPPRIQMLHYLHRAKSLTGGQSYFVDSYAAAEHLRHTNADAFDVLCRANVTFEYTNDGHSRHFERPTIELEDYGKIKAINYSPPFQGPLPLSNRDSIDTIVSALKAFASVLDQEEYRFTIDMQPGQLVIFDNRRVLHARTSFNYDVSEAAVGRWLKGCYVEGDSVLDTLRVLRRRED